LTAVSARGVRFVGAVRLGPRDPSITRIVDGARYVVGFPRRVLEALGGEARLREAVGRAMAASELVVMRRIDKIGKKVDVRKFVRKIEIGNGAATLTRAGLLGDLLPMSVDVSITPTGAVKISEVIEALALGGEEELPFRAVREALGRWGSSGLLVSPLELDALKLPVVQIECTP
jgi:hypothetical protein